MRQAWWRKKYQYIVSWIMVPPFCDGETYDSKTEFESIPIGKSKIIVVSISVQLVPTYNFG